MKQFAFLLALVMSVSACSESISSRYEYSNSGPLLSTNAAIVYELVVVFRLDAFKAYGGGHLVVGRGNLERYFVGGKYPLGAGVIVGEATGCKAPGQISALMEDWYEGYSANDYATCTNGLSADKTYTLTVRRDGYTLLDGSIVVADVKRASTQLDQAGYFIFGAESATPYTLVKLVATAAPVRERLKATGTP